MPIPYPVTLDLNPEQKIADLLREASGSMMRQNEVAARLFTVGAELIENMCDALKAQEDLVRELIDSINRGEASP